MHELDRVFDGEDVPGPRTIDVIDHRGERRRLAASGRPGDEHEARPQIDELADSRRHAELFEGLDRRRNRTKHRTGAGQLAQVVRTEARLGAVRMREVEIATRLERL